MFCKLFNTSHTACQLIQSRFQEDEARILIYSYYAFNKILTSDWLNTNLILDDVWLVGGNVRLVQV